MPVLAVATLVAVDWLSALVVVLTLPLLPFFAALIGRATQAETERRWAALSSLAGCCGAPMIHPWRRVVKSHVMGSGGMGRSLPIRA